MAEVKIEDAISKPLIGGSPNQPSWLSTVINVVREVNTLVNTINNIDNTTCEIQFFIPNKYNHF